MAVTTDFLKLILRYFTTEDKDTLFSQWREELNGNFKKIDENAKSVGGTIDAKISTHNTSNNSHADLRAKTNIIKTDGDGEGVLTNNGTYKTIKAPDIDKEYVDEQLDKKVDKTTTVNNKPLSSDIVLNKSDVGLGNVDNTSDLNKPISTLTQASLDKKLEVTNIKQGSNILLTKNGNDITISAVGGGGGGDGGVTLEEVELVVSTHNTSPDAHADIRTTVDEKISSSNIKGGDNISVSVEGKNVTISSTGSDVDKAYVDAQLLTKVNKVEGMGLSKNDFTDAEKEKLEELRYFSGSYKDLTDTPVVDVNKEYVDTQIGILDTKIETNTTSITETSNKIGELSTLETTNKTNIVNAMNEVFIDVDNGKTLVASAITDKGVDTSKDSTFSEMATNIRSIPSGGESGGVEYSGNLESSKDGEEAWKKLINLPYGFYNGSAVVYNNEIHILGSTSGTSRNHYKFNGNTWISVSVLPYGFYGGNAVVYNNEIHILGGESSGTSRNHYKFNGDDWILMDTLPYTFYGGNAVVYNNEIHILGGESSSNRRNHYKFNGGDWISSLILPSNFYGGSAVVYNNEIHVMGHIGTSRSHYKFNGNTWISVSVLPYDFYNGSAVVYNNEIHILGGGANADRRNHYKFNGGDWISSLILPSNFYGGSAVVYNNEIHVMGNIVASTSAEHYKFNGVSFVINIPKFDNSLAYCRTILKVTTLDGEEIPVSNNEFVINGNPLILYSPLDSKDDNFIITIHKDASILYLKVDKEGKCFVPNGVKVNDVVNTESGIKQLTGIFKIG